jgi:integrase
METLPQMILIEKGKGGKSRYVPVLPELAQELKTHLGARQTGYIFESNRHTKFTARRIQQIVKETAEQASKRKFTLTCLGIRLPRCCSKKERRSNRFRSF